MLLVVVLMIAASMQDLDGGAYFGPCKDGDAPHRSGLADDGYAGKLVAQVEQHCRILLGIIRKPNGQSTFEVLPRHSAVIRTLAWPATSIQSPDAAPGDQCRPRDSLPTTF